MKTLALLALSLAGLAAPALAGGNVCILHNDGETAQVIVLTKPKLPKAAGASSPLTGFLDVSPEAPLTGTVSRGITGSLRAGVTLLLGGGVTCFAHVSIDDTFAGEGTQECTDDLADDVAITWTPTDC